MPKQKKCTVKFNLVLTPQQRDLWESKAQSAGMKVAELIRYSVEQKQIHTIPAPNWELHWELGKIAQNINQIAKAQNTAVKMGLNPPQIDRQIFDELTTLLREIRLDLLLGTESYAVRDEDDWEDN